MIRSRPPMPIRKWLTVEILKISVCVMLGWLAAHLLCSCSGSAPLEPAPTEVDVIAARNITEMNLGRMLLEPPALADIGHTCPVWGICWYCLGEQRDSTHTRPPQQDYGTIYNTINFGMPGMGAWTE